MKQALWLYAWPAAVGFFTIVGYQICGRIAARTDAGRLTVFALAAATAMLSVFGWSTMLRTTRMIPLYGCGVGAAYVMMSRVYGVAMKRHSRLGVRLPRIVWRGDMKTVEALRRQMLENGPR